MEKYLVFDRELKKLLNTKVMIIPIVVGKLTTVSKSLNRSPPQKTAVTGNPRKNRDQSNYSAAEIGQSTESSPRDMKRLAVTRCFIHAVLYYI